MWNFLIFIFIILSRVFALWRCSRKNCCIIEFLKKEYFQWRISKLVSNLWNLTTPCSRDLSQLNVLVWKISESKWQKFKKWKWIEEAVRESKGNFSKVFGSSFLVFPVFAAGHCMKWMNRERKQFLGVSLEFENIKLFM